MASAATPPPTAIDASVVEVEAKQGRQRQPKRNSKRAPQGLKEGLRHSGMTSTTSVMSNLTRSGTNAQLAMTDEDFRGLTEPMPSEDDADDGEGEEIQIEKKLLDVDEEGNLSGDLTLPAKIVPRKASSERNVRAVRPAKGFKPSRTISERVVNKEPEFRPTSIQSMRDRSSRKSLPASFPEDAARNSLQLHEVFGMEEASATRTRRAAIADAAAAASFDGNNSNGGGNNNNGGGNGSAGGGGKNNSSYGSNSSESSILGDISWGSNHFDKAQLLSSFDDLLAVKEGRRIGAVGRVGTSRLSQHHIRNNPMLAATMGACGSEGTGAGACAGANAGLDTSNVDSDRTSGITNITNSHHTLPNCADSMLDTSSKLSSRSVNSNGPGPGAGGGGSGKSGSSGSSRALTRAIGIGNVVLPPDNGDAPGMIPPVFKTIRRNSSSKGNQQVVHVDGGGDGNISAGLGFKESNSKGGVRGILKKTNSFTRRKSQDSQGSRGGGRKRRGSDASDRSRSEMRRRGSNASTQSETMTGFEVLRASFQSARQQSVESRRSSDASNVTRADADDPSGGGGGGGVPRRVPSSKFDRVDSMKDYKIESGDSPHAPSAERRHLNQSTQSPSRQSSQSSVYGRTSSGRSSSIDMSDVSRNDAMNCDSGHLSGNMDPRGNMGSFGREGDQGEGGKCEDDDDELVAEVGGTDYLRASRKVWAMRIIVVATFVVVSIIVTVLTYTFFNDMEEGVLTSNFVEISTNLVTDTAKSLDAKVSSAKTMSKLYTGIFGVQREIGPDDANHPPSALFAPSASECADGTGTNLITSWPNVTMPGHDEIVSSMLDTSKSRAAVFAPLLWGEKEHSSWEKYAASQSLSPAKDVVNNGIRKSEYLLEEPGEVESFARNQALFSDLPPSSSTLRIPAWQVAPARLMEEGIMWDYFSHPPYKVAIDRILRWAKEAGETITIHDGDGDGRRTRQEEAEATAAARGPGPPVAATHLIPCDETLLPLHLNAVPNADPKELSELSELSGPSHQNLHRRRSLTSGAADADGVCSAIFYPVHDALLSTSTNNPANISGVVAEVFSWNDILMRVRHGDVHEIATVVIESRLELPDGTRQSKLASYAVNHDGAAFVGHGRRVGREHEAMGRRYEFAFPGDGMAYVLEVYPTTELCMEGGISRKPTFLAVVAACFFFLSVLVFFVYDYFVNYRQKVVVRSAAHSARIVHSLYPQFVRENLFGNENQKRKAIPVAEAANTNSTQEYDEENLQAVGVGQLASVASCPRRKGLKSKVSDFVDTPATQLKRFLTHPMPSREYDYNLCTEIGEVEPIAEVFENTTVMLADIEGFTAWCSEREPSQVFRLLETVYREFDIEARKLGVFKVETVGDCYVAVTGLPDQRDDHAIVIAKYAVRCLLKFNVLTKRLEANLGPGTATLGMRFGLHSGPVTAGVLRGEKSRFQLFGDTINVASRMESTGKKNMIQVSQDTADLLNAAGKQHWLTPRDDPVLAKGKGSILTYWLKPNARRPSMHGSISIRQLHNEAGNSPNNSPNVPTVSLDRALRQSWKCIGIENDSLVAKERLIRWNAAILESFLLKIVDNRNASADSPDADAFLDGFVPSQQDKHLSFSEKLSETVMFPPVAYREDYYGGYVNVSSDIAISSEAQIELLEYVARIASMYREVPFHNFDHASHVTMSANKLLNRVCTTFEDEEEDISSVAARTFGISADPLAQFVVVFSSLVHDVDHQGVPNAQLVKETDPLAIEFQNRSVAEKRSITVAWNVLMEDRFRKLQSLIFVNGDEMRRFKQLLVNTVLATDIADKKRSAVGKIRWQKAFHPSQTSTSDDKANDSGSRIERLDDVSLRSLKATLVFEQIMQASDVAHTMQHWETFKKWNKRLYKELSKGYREGRGANDPREGWYGGEIGFFDFYIIPLAKKLKECGVFGSAASEYLDYALENRRRWEEEGTEIARAMVLEEDKLVAEGIVAPCGEASKPSKDDVAADPGPPKDAESPENKTPHQAESSPRKDVASGDSPGEMV